MGIRKNGVICLIYTSVKFHLCAFTRPQTIVQQPPVFYCPAAPFPNDQKDGLPGLSLMGVIEDRKVRVNNSTLSFMIVIVLAACSRQKVNLVRFQLFKPSRSATRVQSFQCYYNWQERACYYKPSAYQIVSYISSLNNTCEINPMCPERFSEPASSMN